MLGLAGYNSEADWNLYLAALSASKSGYTIISERDIDEIYINSFNPEWILAWNGNMDLQICLDFFAVITYITEYFTKDDTGTIEVLQNAIKNSNCESLKEKMILLMDTFLTHRQIGEAEAVYKILPDFHFKESNITTVYLQNSSCEERSKFLIRVDGKPQYNKLPTVKIANREGEYIEKYDILSKYMRRDGLEEISAAQFTKMYEPSWKPPNRGKCQTVLIRNKKNKFNFVMTKDLDGHGEFLPETIKLFDPFPNEPPYMRKRRFPAALRFRKFNKNTNAKEYFFSECLLYTSYRKEADIWGKLNGDIAKLELDIRNVKMQVMEHLESNEEARLFVDEAMKNQEVANILDPEGEQEIIDCELEGQILHPDFDHLNPEDLSFEPTVKALEKRFKAIEVEERTILLQKTRNLDFYQRKVVEKGIQYARSLVKSIKNKNVCPKPIFTIVLGGAGSGKSTVINILKQWLHLILRQEGDDPANPYVIVVAPTGTAAANVRGQTLHSAFGFNFGNKHYSLSDKKRDEIRSLLKNLKVVIIDEISMIRSDLFYQLDLRLREITQKENKLFGGVSIYLFGDIMQLKPCRGSFIFDKPLCEEYLLPFLCKSHWNYFDVILLEKNHRQGEDFEYAELLNRLRIGKQTENDLNSLRSRVRPEGHADLTGAMFVSCTNKTVMKMNDVRLNELKTELFEVKARNIHPTIKHFKPKVDEKGTVGGTAFLQNLKFKVGARVMLIHNLDVLDGLSNGSRGTLEAIEKDEKGYVVRLFIKFDELYQGEQKRSKNPALVKQYPGCTPIERYLCQYSLAKKSTVASNTAQVFQFPITVCFAATTHKVQGATVVKPNKLVVDLRTVFEDAMAYVMLSRVEDINQLYIVGSLPESKLRASKKCLDELENLTRRSINKNPPIWEQTSNCNVKVSILNCHSLIDKIVDIKKDAFLQFADIICLSETWLSDDFILDNLNIDGFKLHLNSFGEQRGKGLAVYYRDEVFTEKMKIKYPTLQVSSFSSSSLDVIAIYRSSNCHIDPNEIISLINLDKDTIICGDFNLCFKVKKTHKFIQSLLHLDFEQKVSEATHIQGGLIDQVYFRKGKQQQDVDIKMYSPYYTAQDHDAICVTVFNSI